MCQNLFAIGLPKRVVDDFAKALVPKENQCQSSPISNLPTKNILYDSEFLHVQYQ